MRMNKRMAHRIEQLRASRRLDQAELDPSLQELVSAELIPTAQGLVQKPLLSESLLSSAYPDRTGFEAAASKIHIEDFIADADKEVEDTLVQGFLYAERLAARLAGCSGGYRVMLSVDDESGDVTCRFHSLREGEAWGFAEPDESTEESIVIWEVGERRV